jgi:hypothetical protein
MAAKRPREAHHKLLGPDLRGFIPALLGLPLRRPSRRSIAFSLKPFDRIHRRDTSTAALRSVREVQRRKSCCPDGRRKTHSMTGTFGFTSAAPSLRILAASASPPVRLEGQTARGATRPMCPALSRKPAVLWITLAPLLIQITHVRSHRSGQSLAT